MDVNETRKYLPTIDLCGSGQDNLVSALVRVAEALEQTLIELAETTPHGRDYPEDDTLREAMDKHQEWFEAITRLRTEIFQRAVDIQNI